MLRLTGTIHYHHEAFELVVIIKPMGLLKVKILKYLQIVSKNSFLQFF